MQQIHEENTVGCIQQQILVSLIIREDKVANSDAERIKLCKLSDIVIGTMRCGSTFVDLMKKILNFDIALKKEYNENFVATGIVDIV